MPQRHLVGDKMAAALSRWRPRGAGADMASGERGAATRHLPPPSARRRPPAGPAAPRRPPPALPPAGRRTQTARLASAGGGPARGRPPAGCPGGLQRGFAPGVPCPLGGGKVYSTARIGRKFAKVIYKVNVKLRSDPQTAAHDQIPSNKTLRPACGREKARNRTELRRFCLKPRAQAYPQLSRTKANRLSFS